MRAANANGTNALSPARVASLVVLAGSSMMLPTIAFDWGLAMFLPPHIDERDVELAELVRRALRRLLLRLLRLLRLLLAAVTGYCLRACSLSSLAAAAVRRTLPS